MPEKAKEGNTLILTAEEIKHPVAVRYLWKDRTFSPEYPDWVTGEWRGNSGVYLNGSWEISLLPSDLKYSRWVDYSVAIEKGPLLFAL